MAAVCRKCLKKVPPEAERCLVCKTPVDNPPAKLGGVELKAGPGRPPEIVAAVTNATAVRAFEAAGSGSFGGLTFAQMAQDIAEVAGPVEQPERVESGVFMTTARPERGGRRTGFKWPFRKSDDAADRKTAVRTA